LLQKIDAGTIKPYIELYAICQNEESRRYL
jgi:hypothetical protein